MKKSSLLFALLLALPFAFSSCNKDDDDPAPPPVVGIWELDRLTESDYPAGFEEYNNTSYDYYIRTGLASRFDIKADRTFSEIVKVQGFVFDSDGTWDFSNNTLNINYNDPDQDDASYTYDPATNRLLGGKIPQKDTIDNQIVNYNIQFVYIKK